MCTIVTRRAILLTLHLVSFLYFRQSFWGMQTFMRARLQLKHPALDLECPFRPLFSTFPLSLFATSTSGEERCCGPRGVTADWLHGCKFREEWSECEVWKETIFGSLVAWLKLVFWSDSNELETRGLLGQSNHQIRSKGRCISKRFYLKPSKKKNIQLLPRGKSSRAVHIPNVVA